MLLLIHLVDLSSNLVATTQKFIIEKLGTLNNQRNLVLSIVSIARVAGGFSGVFFVSGS